MAQMRHSRVCDQRHHAIATNTELTQWSRGPSKYYQTPTRKHNMTDSEEIQTVDREVEARVLVHLSVASHDHLAEGLCLRMRSPQKSCSIVSSQAVVLAGRSE